MHALFNPKAYFHFLNVNIPLSAFYELLNSTGTFSTFFSLCMMFGMRFDNVSVILNFIAAANVHLATSSVTITCIRDFNGHPGICDALKR